VKSSGYFISRDRLEILQLFTAQAAISLENVKLYNSLEQQVQERTQEMKKISG